MHQLFMVWPDMFPSPRIALAFYSFFSCTSMDTVVYEVLEQFFPIRFGTEFVRPDASLRRLTPWHHCDNLTSRAIAIAKPLDIVKLNLPTQLLDLPEASYTLTLYQFVELHDEGMKVFLNVGTQHQLWFRPLPIFHVNVVSTIGNLGDGNFTLAAKVSEKTTKRRLDIAILISEKSTVRQASASIADAVIDSFDTYSSSKSKSKFKCVVHQFKCVDCKCRALPVLFQSHTAKKRCAAREPMKRPASNPTRITKELLTIVSASL